MNWCGDGMIASAFDAQPNLKSSSGTPPTAPCSITQVTLPCWPSSSRMRGTFAEMPKPILTAMPSRSSMATRRAITFWMFISGVRNDDSGRNTSPEMAGSYGVSVVCIWSGATTMSSTNTPGTRTSCGFSVPFSTTRLTCAMTTPPLLRAASACSRPPR